MPFKRSIAKLTLVLFVLFIGPSVARGQTRQLLKWRENLAYLQALPADELERQRDAVVQIRTGVEFWLKLHPGTAIQLPSAPSQPWSAREILRQVSLLQDAVENIIKEDPDRPFELGLTVISVTAEASPLSPVTDTIDHGEIKDFHWTNVTQAIQYLPGVTVDHKSARNQSGVMIRGFDTRQVGLYLDNVPIYVPYDGYADIARLLARKWGRRRL